MSSKAITETPEPEAESGEWKPVREFAPSVMQADEPTVPRWFGTMGLVLVVLGVGVFVAHKFGYSTRLGTFGSIFMGPYGGSLLFILGLGGLLYHAARDTDVQVRRLYALFGFFWLAAAGLLAVWPAPDGMGAYFLSYGYPCLILGLIFLMPVAHNETDTKWRQAMVNVIGVVGFAAAATGLIGGQITTNFLTSYGLLLSVLGLCYLWAFIGLRGAADDLSHRVGWGMGIAGGLVFLVALGRSVLPPLFYSWRWVNAPPTPHYLESSGVLLMMVGFVYVGMSAGLVSDNRFAVLTRRELAAFFYSPLAYIVLFAFACIAAGQFAYTVSRIIEVQQRSSQPIPEPIIMPFVFSLLPVVAMILVVPLLTMRLFSEEYRSGTLEVLLTSPVEETPIVLSKFTAALIVFVLTWLPFGLFLIALRVEGGQPFDYRPIVSFAIALVCTGAGFIGMGLFLSALTRNQVAAGVLCAVGMVLFMMVFLIKDELMAGSAWDAVLTHISFIDLWRTSLQGKLSLPDVMFFLTSAVFWVFLTIKVLESRKWR